MEAGMAPKVDLEDTNKLVLGYCSLSDLAEHAISESQKQAA